MADKPTKTKGMTRLPVALSADQRKAIKEIADRNGLKESQVIRQIVDEFLKRNAGKTVRFTFAVEE